ncbi:MFS transporter [Pedobacter sp.]|nr:MFS transporter [Candidatus Saccharibacteria bacterium]
MLKSLIYRFLERRHYWRYVDFEELARLYTSRTLRMLAVSMVSIFTVVYLYQNGYTFVFIMCYLVAYFLLRAIVQFPSAFLVARIGPKHVTLISNILYVPALVSITMLPKYGIVALAIFGIFQAISSSLYEISYLINFSKVKKDGHAGKELGFMYMLERIAAGASPLIGGMIAFLFGPQATMITAAILFGLAALPLLYSPEPTRTRQQISFRGLNWKLARKGLIAHMAIGADVIASGALWSLFIAISIFGTSSNAIYAQLGALASVTIVASLLFAHLYGVFIDRRRGGELLRFGVIVTSLVHIARIFISTPVGVVMTNVTNESATAAYAMPFTKGMFDVADTLSGFRIVYITLMCVSGTLGAALFAGTLALLALFLPVIMTMQIGFTIAAVVVLLIMRHGFPALTTRRFF